MLHNWNFIPFTKISLFPLPPNPWKSSFYSLLRYDYFIPHISEITQYLSLCVRHISLSIMSFRYIHLSQVAEFLSFLRLSNWTELNIPPHECVQMCVRVCVWHFFNPFILVWLFRLFSYPNYCDYCYNEHGGSVSLSY